MCFEIVLAGYSSPNKTEQLNTIVERASQKVRGAIRREIHTQKNIVVAMVECSPVNGDMPVYHKNRRTNELLIGIVNNEETKDSIIKSTQYTLFESREVKRLAFY